MNSRERIITMLDGQAVDHLPNMAITMMFAADQIGTRYREYATNYQLLAEGQIRTAEAFGIDHVSVISDPAVEAADCGAVAMFYPDQPPAIDESNALLLDKVAFIHLKTPSPYGPPNPADSREPHTPEIRPGRMYNRIQGVSLLKERAGKDKLVEGWIEGPCAESADLRGINNLMLDFIDDPAFVRDLFDFVLAMETEFAKAQVSAGADIIGIGDAAASLVGPQIYRDFIWPYEKQMVDAIHALGARVRLHICGNTRRIVDGMGRLGCDLVDLDYLTPVSLGRAQMGAAQVLLGNIDPVRVLRQGTPDSVYDAIGECHRQAGQCYIVGAGCEVPRDTPSDNLQALSRYAIDQR